MGQNQNQYVDLKFGLVTINYFLNINLGLNDPRLLKTGSEQPSLCHKIQGKLEICGFQHIQTQKIIKVSKNDLDNNK